MKYGSGEICNALLSGLSYNGVHANYACRLPPAPGRGPPSARPARAPAGGGGGAREAWGGGEEAGRTMGKGVGRVERKVKGEGGREGTRREEEEEGRWLLASAISGLWKGAKASFGPRRKPGRFSLPDQQGPGNLSDQNKIERTEIPRRPKRK